MIRLNKGSCTSTWNLHESFALPEPQVLTLSAEEQRPEHRGVCPMRKRLPVALALLAPLSVAALLAGCNSSSNDAGGGGGVKRLRGGGATFVQPIMEVWAHEYQKAKGTEVDYQAKGSGNGIQQMTEQT